MSDEFWKFAAVAAPTLAAIVATLTSWSSKMVSLENKKDIKTVHMLLNSRLDEWKEETKKSAVAAAVAAYNEGVAEGNRTK